MTPHLKYTYLLLMLVLFSCTKNELPTIIDYPLALAELHAHEFIPPAGLEPEELTYYEDENQLGVGFSADYPQKLEIPPKIVTSNTCTPKMDLKEHPEFYFSTYSHIGVIEMDTGEALLRQQLQDHVFHHVNSPSPTFDQQLYLVSYTYLPSSKQWVQNIPISIGVFHTNSQHSATRSDYAKIAAHLLTHGSIYENPQTHLIWTPLLKELTYMPLASPLAIPPIGKVAT